MMEGTGNKRTSSATAVYLTPETTTVPEKPTESVVYVIGNADNRLVKIGTTTKHKLERLAGIQTMSPSILTVLWTTPGDRELEHKLHYRFRAERRHGEWFDFGNGDPVATVSAAVAELANVEKPAQARQISPLEELWRTLGRVRAWYLDEAESEDHYDEPAELGYVVALFADIVGDALTLPTAPARVAEARAALHIAADCLSGVDYPDVDGLASPKKLIAMASSAAWMAKCMAGAIEDDTFSLYAPEHVANFTRQAAVAVIGLSDAVAMARLALRDAERRWDVERGAHRTLDSTVEEIGNLGRGLIAAANSIREFSYRGYVGYGDHILFDAMLDELQARGLEPEGSRQDMRIRFVFHDEPCALVRGIEGWVVEWMTSPYKVSHRLGAPAEGAHHPGQIVSRAVLFLDRKINNGTYPVELETPQYVANPNWEAPGGIDRTWEGAPDDDDAPNLAEAYHQVIHDLRHGAPAKTCDPAPARFEHGETP